MTSLSREKAQIGFERALAQYVPEIRKLEIARVRALDVSKQVEDINQQFGSQRWWKRLIGWVKEKVGKEPVVPTNVQKDLEDAQAKLSTREYQTYQIIEKLHRFGANLPGTHRLVNILYDSRATECWVVKFEIDQKVGDTLVAVPSTGEFAHLRFMTQKPNTRNLIRIPRTNSLSPVLILEEDRDFTITLVSRISDNRYDMNPSRTKQAQDLNYYDFKPRKSLIP